MDRTKEDIRKMKNIIPSNFLMLLPGVQLESKTDSIGQTYITPEIAVRGGADGIIVGRGILQSINPQDTAKKYRETAWNEYLKR
jgi:orotidine-5'-phosphate decarboxylase